MEKYLVLKKSKFNEFISKLAKMQPLVAPVKKGQKSYAFEQVTTGEEVSLDYIPTILPPKKYFLPQKETLMKFDKDKYKWIPVTEYKKMTIFGVHTCDLAGIQCLNMVFYLKT
jgi:sulfhydrogenase subunit beta (sulfur reductase)